MNETHNTSKHYHRIAMALRDLAEPLNLYEHGHHVPGLRLALLEKAHGCECMAIYRSLDADKNSAILYNSRQAIEDAITEEKRKNATQEVGNAD